jgi:hypothetical protein
MFHLVCAVLATATFTAVSVADPSVEYVKDYVATKIAPLFPGNHRTVEIRAAEQETAVGDILKLFVKISRGVSFIITLQVDGLGQIRVQSIASTPPRKNLADDYRWDAPSSLTETDFGNSQTTSHRPEVNVTVLAVRTRNLSETKRQVIFTDEKGTLYSVVMHTNLQQNRSLKSFQRIPVSEIA